MNLAHVDLDPNSADFCENVTLLANYLFTAGQRVKFYYDGTVACRDVFQTTPVMYTGDRKVISTNPSLVEEERVARARGNARNPTLTENFIATDRPVRVYDRYRAPNNPY